MAKFKLIDRDTVIKPISSNRDEYRCSDVIKKGTEKMKHKSVCVVDIKPKTMVLNFRLENPYEMEREPAIKGVEPRSDRDYIGMNYTKTITAIMQNFDNIS